MKLFYYLLLFTCGLSYTDIFHGRSMAIQAPYFHSQHALQVMLSAKLL
jgi:hypothetical protein